MIYARIHRVLERWQRSGRILPQSSLGKAISYALGQWQSLEVYLKDGTIEIDNNLVENAIRPTALGKKNWLFFGDADAGRRSAVLYTIVECCRRRGLDHYAYVRDLLTRLPTLTTWPSSATGVGPTRPPARECLPRELYRQRAARGDGRAGAA
jgi:hypothetical protein